MSCFQECNSGNTTTTSYINNLFDPDTSINNILFPTNPDLKDLHIAIFLNGTAYYIYNGLWVLDSFREDYYPECIDPCNHTHDLTDVLGLSNSLDTLYQALQSFGEELQNVREEIQEDGYIHPNHTGDVTSIGDGATVIANNAVTTLKIAPLAITSSRIQDLSVTESKIFTGAVITSKIADDAVTNTKLSDVPTATIKGRVTAGTGDPEDLTATQVRTLLNVADGANNYVHPNHTGDVTSTGDGATTIAANAVTETKIANGSISTTKIIDDAVTDDKLSHTAVTPGTYTNAQITVNQQGRVTSVSSLISGVHVFMPPTTGDIITALIDSSNVVQTNLVANTLYFYPFIPRYSFSVTSALINVDYAVSGMNFRFLIYSNLNNKPDTKLYESSNIDVDTFGDKSTSISFSFVAGTVYWLAHHSGVNLPILKAMNTSSTIPVYTGTQFSFNCYTLSVNLGSAPVTVNTASLTPNLYNIPLYRLISA